MGTRYRFRPLHQNIIASGLAQGHKEARLGAVGPPGPLSPAFVFATKIQQMYELYQRGLSEAQNGYGFGMIPGYGRRDGYLTSLALDGSPACKLFIAPEYVKVPVTAPMPHGLQREPYFSQPDVHTRSATAPNYMIFGVLVLLWLQKDWSGNT